jgi:hypothetical protein
MNKEQKEESMARLERWHLEDSLNDLIRRINWPHTTLRAFSRAHAIVDQLISWGEIKLKDPISPYTCPFVDLIRDKVTLLEYYKTADSITVDGWMPSTKPDATKFAPLTLTVVFCSKDNKLTLKFEILPWGEISPTSVTNDIPSIRYDPHVV